MSILLKTKANYSKTALPNLVVIGAMKCGTSSLHQYLNLHPQIQMSNHKELDFFTNINWNKGVDWYRSNFTNDAKIIGESSPNYTKYPAFPEIPARMYSIIPNAKLIYIVRDPIKRIVSHYIHQYIARWENREFSKAMENLDNNHYLNCSLYHMQLQQFLAYYSLEQILVIDLEDLSKNTNEVLRKVFDFLDVDVDYIHPEFSRIFHKSNCKKRLNAIGVKVTRLPGGKRFIKPFSSILEYSVKEPIITQKIRKSLENKLRPDIEKFRKLTGESFANWSF